MNNKLLSVVAVLALVVGLLGLFLPTSVKEIVRETIVGGSGTSFLNGLYVATFKDLDSTIPRATSSPTASQLCENTYIELAFATTSGASVTLPTAPLLTAQCFDSIGATRTVFLKNASSGASALNIIAGASSTLYSLNNATSGSAQAGLVSAATTTLISGATGQLTGVRIVSSTPWIVWFFEVFKN